VEAQLLGVAILLFLDFQKEVTDQRQLVRLRESWKEDVRKLHGLQSCSIHQALDIFFSTLIEVVPIPDPVDDEREKRRREEEKRRERKRERASEQRE
jgi:hypothetical protein